MRRLLKLLAILMALGLIAAACGNDDDGGDTAATGDEETADTTEDTGDTDEAASDDEDEGGEVTEEGPGGGEEAALRWRTRPDNQAEIDVYASVSADLDAASELYSLQYEPGGSETSSYQDVLKTELASGTAPDVFWIPGTDIADFATRGLILDLRELASGTEGYSDDDFYPGPMFHLTFDPETATDGGPLWGLPRDVSSFALYLNMDLISQAGAEDPRELSANGEWDWDAFVEVANQVAEVGGETKGFAMNNWWANYGYWMNAAGGGFFNEDRTACALDTPESIEGLQFVTDLYGTDAVVPFGEDGEPPFLAGNVGMFINGRWATPGARAGADFTWDVVKLPDGPAGPSNWLFWGAYVVNAETENPEAAWQLVQDLTTAETQAAIAELGANIPSRETQEAQDAFLTFIPPDNSAAFLEGITENPVTEGPLWAGSWPEYDGIMTPAVQAVIAGSQSIESFQESICNEANAAFSS